MEAGNPLPPGRLKTPHAVLERWQQSDAERLNAALEASRGELSAWTPWVLDGVGDLVALRERLKGYEEAFEGGGNLLYAVLDRRETTLLGGAGLYRRVGVGGLEIGYWIRSDRTGMGLATEASRALVGIGFAFREPQRIEIHCRADNAASIRIPQKLGFELRESAPGTADRPGETQIWELNRSAWKGSAPNR